MRSIRIISAIFLKQLKDSLKNMEVLILFFIFPIIAFVMTNAMNSAVSDKVFFLAIFGTMHCIFVPLVSTATIIAEEKEKNTLRVLILSNIKPAEYCISIGGFTLLLTLLTGSSFIWIGGYGGFEALKFMLAILIGSIISVLLGLAIGAHAKNMASANGLAVPVGMLFAFLPMLASFNGTIRKISNFLYGQQINYLISGAEKFDITKIVIIIINFIILLAAFVLVFKKNKLDE